MTEHEADRTTYEMMDRAVTQSAILVGDILQYMIELLSGLRVFPDRMRRNLDLSGGLIMSEALLCSSSVAGSGVSALTTRFTTRRRRRWWRSGRLRRRWLRSRTCART